MKPKSEEIAWKRHPEAAKYLRQLFDEFVDNMPEVKNLQKLLLTSMGLRLWDWLDYMVLAEGSDVRQRLEDLGFETQNAEVPEPGTTVHRHPGAIFPSLLVGPRDKFKSGAVFELAIKVEKIPAFLSYYGISAPIEGSPLSPYRRTMVWRQQDGRRFSVVERRGYNGFIPQMMDEKYPGRYLGAYERWLNRRRDFADMQEGYRKTEQLARSIVKDTGTHMAAWIAFEAEREYWGQKNRAGRVRKQQQDHLGLGWANHDHHTFRSSRGGFGSLINLLKIFGFQLREKFYAGAQAGWGAQVLEQPVCDITVFSDVDLEPREVETDFAHESLKERNDLGTVGLWCALHGESLFQAGLHHIACRFDFDAVTEELQNESVRMLQPFSDFDYLKQSFTEGERWKISRMNLDRLLNEEKINETQHRKFRKDGAIGSHLEDIQRDEGFKGFNQESVSDIIRRTDPRSGFGAA